MIPGIVGSVEETLALNALVVYWNPLESPAKVNLKLTPFHDLVSGSLTTANGFTDL